MWCEKRFLYKKLSNTHTGNGVILKDLVMLNMKL